MFLYIGPATTDATITAVNSNAANVSVGSTTSTGSISNLCLYLAVETNLEIVNKVVKQCLKCLQILILYI